MLNSIALIVAGLVGLYGGGELLVRGAVAIGHWIGLSSLVVGLTIVAFGTSAPELAVSLEAALAGSSEIAIANVVGSNIANIALVLALSAMLVPIAIDKQLLKRDLPVMMIGFAVLLLMMMDGRVGRFEGAALVATLAGYLIYVIRHTPDARVEEPDVQNDSVGLTLLMLAAGAGLLALGGNWLVTGAVQIAAGLGVSEAVIGMTVVAIGTSLPEITASLISIARGHCCMAVGNVVGSNIWNTFGVLGATALALPLDRGQVTDYMLGFMITAGIVLWVFCRSRFQLSRLEGGLLLTGFAVSQVVVILY